MGTAVLQNIKLHITAVKMCKWLQHLHSQHGCMITGVRASDLSSPCECLGEPVHSPHSSPIKFLCIPFSFCRGMNSCKYDAVSCSSNICSFYQNFTSFYWSELQTQSLGVITGLVWSVRSRKVLVWPFQPDGTEAETMAAAVWCLAAWDR